MHYVKYMLSKEYCSLFGATDIYLMKYTKDLHPLINNDLVVTIYNIRLLLYNICKEKITAEKKANSNYFNSYNLNIIDKQKMLTPIMEIKTIENKTKKNLNDISNLNKELKNMIDTVKIEEITEDEELDNFLSNLIDEKTKRDKEEKIRIKMEEEKEEKEKKERKEKYFEENKKIILEEKKETTIKIITEKIANEYSIDNTYNIYGEKNK